MGKLFCCWFVTETEIKTLFCVCLYTRYMNIKVDKKGRGHMLTKQCSVAELAGAQEEKGSPMHPPTRTHRRARARTHTHTHTQYD